MTYEDLTDLNAGDDAIEFRTPDIFDIYKERAMDDIIDTTTSPFQYNPFVNRRAISWDDKCIDRMLTVKKPKTTTGSIWVTDADFAETLSLIPLSRSEQAHYWKKFRKIQMCASGEMNKKIVDSRQERLMIELLSQKSRLDAIVGGNINERGMWNTQNTEIISTLNYLPSNEAGSIIETLMGKIGINKKADQRATYKEDYSTQY